MDLIHGVNGSNRKEEGMKLLHEAANAGNVKAMYRLGVFYQVIAISVGENPVKAVEWFSKAAELGHLGAMKELAQRYLFGEGVEEDVDKAVKLLIEAANLGNAQSMFILGRLYHFGDKIPRDQQKAFEWYSRAADNGILPARKNLLRLKNFIARIEKLGDDTDAIAKAHEAETLFLAGKEFLNNRNFTKAKDYLKRSAALGNSDAVTSIGTMYLNGYGVEKNPYKAQKLFQQAADAGSNAALGYIGSMYLDERGTKNFHKALEYIQRASEAGDENAMTFLGSMYCNGLGVTKNKDKAFDLLTKALSLGSITALIMIMQIIEEGNCCLQKLYSATDLFMNVLTTYMDNPSLNELVDTALLALEPVYMNWKLDAKKFDRLFKLLEQAADEYHPQAIFLLGLMYMRGDGVAKDSAKGSTLMAKGLELGGFEAEYVPPKDIC